MHLPSPRRLLVSALLAATITVPATVHAGGAVLATSGGPDPSFVDVRIAVAASSAGSTRWVEVTVPAGTRAAWLVPIRPGATIAWAPPRWLDALDEATAPRVLPPSSDATCDTRSSPERPASWVSAATAHTEAPFAMLATADAARAHVVEHGLRMDVAREAQITALYEAGWRLVAVALAAPSVGRSSTATLRVSDDGGAILPLALSGTSPTRLTVFAIGAGVASVPGTVHVDPQALRWGPSGSDYEAWRRDTLGHGVGAAWLEESSSHDALFDPAPLEGSSEVIPPVAPPASRAGDVDLALALDGLSARDAVVTRLAGALPADTLGANLAIAFSPGATLHDPRFRAGSREPCAAAPGSTPSPTPRRPMPTGGGGDATIYEPASEGCSGGPSGTTTYDARDGRGGEGCATDDSSSSSSSESCARTSSSSSSGGDDGWDTGRDDDDDGWDTGDDDDGWDTGDDDDGWDTGDDDDDDDDGWDTGDDMSPKGVTPKGASNKRTSRTTSPISRLALLAAALLLPLRRRIKGRPSDERLDR